MSPTTRQARKTETRRALRAAARDLFAETGFEETSVASITSTAGVAHGTFYVHFPSKEALLDELLEEFNDGLVAELTPIVSGPDTHNLPHLVHAIAETFLDYWSARRGFVELYARRVTAGLNLEQLRDGINPPATRLLTVALERLAGVGRAVPEPDLVAHALLAAWLRVGLQHLFADGVDRERARRALVHITLGLLRPASETP